MAEGTPDRLLCAAFGQRRGADRHPQPHCASLCRRLPQRRNSSANRADLSVCLRSKCLRLAEPAHPHKIGGDDGRPLLSRCVAGQPTRFLVDQQPACLSVWRNGRRHRQPQQPWPPEPHLRHLAPGWAARRRCGNGDAGRRPECDPQLSGAHLADDRRAHGRAGEWRQREQVGAASACYTACPGLGAFNPAHPGWRSQLGHGDCHAQRQAGRRKRRGVELAACGQQRSHRRDQHAPQRRRRCECDCCHLAASTCAPQQRLSRAGCAAQQFGRGQRDCQHCLACCHRVGSIQLVHRHRRGQSERNADNSCVSGVRRPCSNAGDLQTRRRDADRRPNRQRAARRLRAIRCA